MQQTPFFSSWRAQLAPMGPRSAPAFQAARAYTLNQLEEHFGPWLPADLFPKAARKANSRDRIYTRSLTFWSMLWQSLHPQAAGRLVVRQIQALFLLRDGPRVSEEDGAYCRAKARLPVREFPKALSATAAAADRLAPARDALQGRPTKIIDGSTVTAPDTPKNRKAYPPVQCPQPNFPMLRVVVLFSLLSGAVLSVVTGTLRAGELPMLYQMFDQLAVGDILVGDRCYGNFVLLALLQHVKPGVDFLGRSVRQVDGRHRYKRLAKNDWLIHWKRGKKCSLWLPLPLWLALPKQLTVRMVRGSCYVKGFRVRQLTVVTTLLDAQQYPAPQILQAYLQRWRLELCLDDLKTTLEMEMLRAHNPTMLFKELHTRLIAHNLIRCTMAQAASHREVSLERISFKGTLDALRSFTQAMSQARTKKKRSQLWTALLDTLAADLLPKRPGRREPRAVKRRKSKYPRLNAPRQLFVDRPKKSKRRRAITPPIEHWLM
jgi:ribosomal protein L17